MPKRRLHHLILLLTLIFGSVAPAWAGTGSQEAGRLTWVNSRSSLHLFVSKSFKQVGVVEIALEENNEDALATIGAWMSEVIPLASDIRTIQMESYKAETGCDRVDNLALNMAAAGIIVDVVTLGRGGMALKGVKMTSKAVIHGSKQVLKELVKNAAVAYTLSEGIKSYLQIAAYIKTQYDQLPADHWVVKTNVVIMKIATATKEKVGSEYANYMHSVDDIVRQAELITQYGVDLLESQN